MQRPDNKVSNWLRQSLGSAAFLLLVGALARLALRRRLDSPRRRLATNGTTPQNTTRVTDIQRAYEGQYDIRHGVAAYAPIVALFGSLSVPAIVVVFAVPPASDAAGHGTRIALATGLLVIGMVGSLLGAIGLAAIGAERDPTANLAAATMFIAIPTVLSIASTLGAFEVLAVLYAPQARMMFVLITAAGGVFGVVFNAYSASDSLGLGPTDSEEHQKWVKHQWLKDRAAAYKWGNRVALIASTPLVASGILTYLGIRIPLTATSVNVIIGVGVAISLAGTFLSVRRTAHPLDGPQVGLRPREAFGSNLTISLYVAALILCLP